MSDTDIPPVPKPVDLAAAYAEHRKGHEHFGSKWRCCSGCELADEVPALLSAVASLTQEVRTLENSDALAVVKAEEAADAARRDRDAAREQAEQAQAEIAHLTRERDEVLLWVSPQTKVTFAEQWAAKRATSAPQPKAAEPTCNGNCIQQSGMVVIEDLCCPLHGVNAAPAAAVPSSGGHPFTAGPIVGVCATCGTHEDEGQHTPEEFGGQDTAADDKASRPHMVYGVTHRMFDDLHPAHPGQTCAQFDAEPATAGGTASSEPCPSTGGICQPNYYCPTVGEVESPCHGGFDVCCDKPELHRPVSAAGVTTDGEEQP